MKKFSFEQYTVVLLLSNELYIQVLCTSMPSLVYKFYNPILKRYFLKITIVHDFC